jgi:quinol monooxygenase YgiN
LSVIVVATFEAAPGRADELVAVLSTVIPEVHAEDGCELYSLHRDGDLLVIIEKWTSRDALAVHSGGAALAGLGPRMQGLVAGAPNVVRLDALPAGDSAKGVL